MQMFTAAIAQRSPNPGKFCDVYETSVNYKQCSSKLYT